MFEKQKKKSDRKVALFENCRIGLLEVSVKQSLESLTVARFVACQLVYGVKVLKNDRRLNQLLIKSF